MDQALNPPPVGPATAELERFPALTSLRFFAAGHVVLHHFLPPLSDKWRALKNVAGHGYVGVGFFYVLSGFVLAHAFRHRQPATPEARRAFWWRRFARIYPVYVLAFLAYAPFVIRHRFAVDLPGIATLKLVVASFINLAALQAWAPPLSSSWNAPSWSISVEAFFYLSFPWLLPWLLSLKRPLSALGLCWLSSLLVPVAAMALGLTSLTDARALAAQPFLKFLPLIHLPAFAFGIALRRLRESVCVAPIWLPVCVLALVALLVVVPRGLWLLLHDGGLLPLYGVALLAATTPKPGRQLLDHRLLVFLGESSYALYILQVPVWLWSWPYLSRLGPSAGFCAYVALIITTAAVAHVAVELPAQRWLVRRLVARAARPA